MGDRKYRKFGWVKVAVEEIKWGYKTIKASGSEELKYIIELITDGREPGIPIREDDSIEKDNRH